MRLYSRKVISEIVDTLVEAKKSAEFPWVKTTKGEHSAALEGSRIIHETPDVVVRRVESHDAMRVLGSKTSWCTVPKGAGAKMFTQYQESGPVYHLHDKNTGDRRLIHWQTKQFMDEKDHPDYDLMDKYRDAMSATVHDYRDEFRKAGKLPNSENPDHPDYDTFSDPVADPQDIHEKAQKFISGYNTGNPNQASRAVIWDDLKKAADHQSVRSDTLDMIGHHLVENYDPPNQTVGEGARIAPLMLSVLRHPKTSVDVHRRFLNNNSFAGRGEPNEYNNSALDVTDRMARSGGWAESKNGPEITKLYYDHAQHNIDSTPSNHKTNHWPLERAHRIQANILKTDALSDSVVRDHISKSLNTLSETRPDWNVNPQLHDNHDYKISKAFDGLWPSLLSKKLSSSTIHDVVTHPSFGNVVREAGRESEYGYPDLTFNGMNAVGSLLEHPNLSSETRSHIEQKAVEYSDDYDGHWRSRKYMYAKAVGGNPNSSPEGLRALYDANEKDSLLRERLVKHPNFPNAEVEKEKEAARKAHRDYRNKHGVVAYFDALDAGELPPLRSLR